MADQVKIMGAADFEHALKTQFPNSDKVNILYKQILKSKAEFEQENGEDPYFLGSVLERISKSAHIFDFIDRYGKINDSFGAVIKSVQKESIDRKIRETKEQEEIEKKQKMQEQILAEQEQQIAEEVSNMDFEKLSLDNMATIAENYDIASQYMTTEEELKYFEQVGRFLGSKEQCQELIKLSIKVTRGEKLTEEDRATIKNLSSEQIEKYHIDLDHIEDSLNNKTNEKMHNLIQAYNIVVSKVNAFVMSTPEGEEIKCNELLKQSEIAKLLDENPGLINAETLQKNIINEKQYGKEEITGTPIKPKMQQSAPKTELNSTFRKPLDIDAMQDTVLELDSNELNEKDLFSMNDALADMLLGMEFDPVEQTPPDQIYDYSDYIPGETLWQRIAPNAYFEEHGENLEDKAKPQATYSPVQQIQTEVSQRTDTYINDANLDNEEYTFEVPDKKGIVGLFVGLGNRVKNFFQTKFARKEDAKLLNPAEPEVTRQDDIKITSYVGDGNMPSRNPFVRFSVGLMDNITNTIKKTDKSIDETAMSDVDIHDKEQVNSFMERINPDSHIYDETRPSPTDKINVMKNNKFRDMADDITK